MIYSFWFPSEEMKELYWQNQIEVTKSCNYMNVQMKVKELREMEFSRSSLFLRFLAKLFHPFEA